MKKFPNSIIGYIDAEDTTCSIYCDCDKSLWHKNEYLWVSDYKIVRCPHCGKGYKTELVVWQFEPDEIDENIK